MRAIWNYDADLIVLQFLKLDSLPLLRRAYQISPVQGQLHCQSQTCSNVGGLLLFWWLFKMTFDDDLMTTGPAAWLTTPEEPWLVSPESSPSLSFPLSSPGNRQEIFVRVGGQRRLFECLFCPPFLSPSHISCRWYHGSNLELCGIKSRPKYQKDMVNTRKRTGLNYIWVRTLTKATVVVTSIANVN